MEPMSSETLIGHPVVIEAGQYVDETGIIVATSPSGATLTVLTRNHGEVTVRRSSVEVYS
jgi:hypothetical protein